MSTKNKSTEDILRIEGVKSKGYGIVPKAAMTDRDISVAAKAIYAYFCSLSGRGETVFPGRSKILLDLQISKEAYYKGLNELIDAGYIRVTQEHNSTSGGKFMRNIYTLVARPAKYRKVPTDHPAKALAYQEIILSGIDSQGYGYIPYAVMSDPRMRFQPKATYGYLSAHIGPNNTADLDASIIAYHLGISKPHTVQGYMKQLKVLNYVTITRLLENGRYTGKNRYCLVQMPDDTQAQKKMIYINTPAPLSIISAPESNNTHSLVPNAENQDTAVPNAEIQDTAIPNAEIQDTATPNAVFQDAVKQDAVKQDAVFQDTNNNSPTSNSFTTISSTNNSIVIDRLIARVRSQISYDIMCFAYGGTDTELAALNTLVQAVAEALASPAPRINIGNEPLVAAHVRDVLLTISNTAACNVLERFLARVDRISSKNHKSYLLTAIYRELNNTPADDGCGAYYSIP